MSRTKIDPRLRDLILLESGYKCANPNCRTILVLDSHHIIPVSKEGKNEESNLIALCPNCHALYHRNSTITDEAIKTWKGILLSLNNPNRASADLLLFLYKDFVEDNGENEHLPFSFTGDSLFFLSPLINSRLVEIVNHHSGLTFSGMTSPYFNIALTEKGKRLVGSWLSGDSSKITNILSDS